MFVQYHNFGDQSIVRCGHPNGKHNSDDHIHEFLEMEMILEGEIEITVEGKRHIARPGDLAVIPPFKLHSFYTPEYVRATIFVFSNNFLPESVPYDELCRSREACVFHAPEPLWRYLTENGFHSSFASLYDPVTDKDRIHWVRSIVYLILSEYFRAVPAIAGRSAENTLSRILIYMSEHYTEPLTQASIGAELGYSPKYISNCFRALGDLGFRDVLNSMRINHAKHLLVTTDHSNVRIAMECGFSSVSTFHQVFLANVGCPPKQYRASHKK